MHDEEEVEDDPTTREGSEEEQEEEVRFKNPIHAPQIDDDFEKELAALNLSESASRNPIPPQVILCLK